MVMRRALAFVVLAVLAVTPALAFTGDDLSAASGLHHQPYRAWRATAGAAAAPGFSPDLVTGALVSPAEPPRAASPLARPPFVPPRG